MRSNPRSSLPIVRVLLLASVLAATACDAKETSTTTPQLFPEALLGTWLVTNVAEPHAVGEPPSPRASGYKYNIHKFLGRVFVFTPKGLIMNMRWEGSKEPCDLSITVHDRVTTKGSVEHLSLLCKDGRWARVSRDDRYPDIRYENRWLIDLRRGQPVLSGIDEAILTLRRLPENAKPVASFDCAKATTATEKTICASVSLAAYDVSVTESYIFTHGYYQSTLEKYKLVPGIHKQTEAQFAALTKSQKQWLTQRNACGNDAACLEKSMDDRIQAMESEIVEYSRRLSDQAKVASHSAATSAATAFPTALLGTWQVKEVRLDRGDTSPRGYKFNIHKYLGRVFEFTRERLTSNAGTSSGREICKVPQIIVHRTTALKAVSQSLCSRMLEPVQPVPADFGLPLANDAKIEVLSPLCADGLYEKRMGGCQNEPNPDEIQGAWLIALAPDRLALRWNDEVFLILQRLPKDTKPVASFDCAKAATPTEKAICGSVALAAYDVSVAETYKHALGFYQFALKTYDADVRQHTLDQLAAFKQSQKEWVTKRDTCGADIVCLDKSMGDRIWIMEHEIALYAYNYKKGITSEYYRK